MQEEIQKESKEVYEVDWILPVHSVRMRKSYQECTHALHACKKLMQSAKSLRKQQFIIA